MQRQRIAPRRFREAQTLVERPGGLVVTFGDQADRPSGRAPDLASIENRLRFTLRHRSHTHRGLQAAWDAHGPEAFRLEELERLEKESLAYIRDRILKERLGHWQAKLGAEPI